MSETLEFIKRMYLRAKKNDFEWRDYHPNNIENNEKEGIFTEFCVKNKDKYDYTKYTIVYMYPTNENMVQNRENGVKYYCLYTFRMNDLPKEYKTPAVGQVETDYRMSVNNFGYLCAIFDDEETAKRAVVSHILGRLYPYGYILSEKESKEWIKFLKEQGENIGIVPTE